MASKSKNKPANPVFKIGMVLYEGFDPTDIVGPHEVFAWLRNNWTGTDLQIDLIAETMDPPDTSTHLQICPTATFDTYPEGRGGANLIFVPGATPEAFLAAMENATLLAFIQAQANHAEYICSVCFGAFVLGKAGLLTGCEVTTYWSAVEYLHLFPGVKAAPFYPRYVHSFRHLNGRRVQVMTGGGISSGIDEALRLAEILAGTEIAEKVQLGIQYNPRPPLSSGDPTVADPKIWQPSLDGFKSEYGGKITAAIGNVGK